MNPTSIPPRNGVHARPSAAPASPAARPTASEGSPVIPGTDLAYDPELISADGMIPLILSGCDPDALGELRQACGPAITTPLPLVNGVVSRIALDRVAGLLPSLPAGTTVVPDHRLALPEPGDIRRWEEASGVFNPPPSEAPDALPAWEPSPEAPGPVATGVSPEMLGDDAYPHAAMAAPPQTWNDGPATWSAFPSMALATAVDGSRSGSAASAPSPAPAPPPKDGPPVDIDRVYLGLPDLHQAGFTGKGVGIAVIDSGIYPHPELKDRITGWVDIASGKPQPYDSFGHGTNVAGIAAGDGRLSQGRLAGVAPEASLVGVRVETASEAIKGVQWVIENKDRLGIQVINMSLGDTPNQSYKDDLWTQLVEKAIGAGLCVVVSAGNEGSNNTAHSIARPGIDPLAITVGAMDLKGTLDPSDDIVAPFSSRGPTTPDELPKPDIVAPGVRIFGALSPNSRLDQPELAHVGRDYLGISGTSQATPVVTGAVALMLQANPRLTQAEVKDILMRTARPYLKDDRMGQGAGVVDIGAAVAQAVALAKEAPGADLRPATVASAPVPSRPAPAAIGSLLASLQGDSDEWRRLA